MHYNRGKLIIFSAPSGSGKTTIINRMKDQFNLSFSVSATTRQPREGELHGKHYLFLSLEEFKQKIAEGAFLEYEEVYPNVFYGTLKSQVDESLSEGKSVIFDIDVVGGLSIKKQYKDQALSIFIQAPSITELEQRLIKRGTDSAEVIKERVKKSKFEMTFAPKFDKIIVNDNLEDAVIDSKILIEKFLYL